MVLWQLQIKEVSVEKKDSLLLPKGVWKTNDIPYSGANVGPSICV